MMNTYTPFPEPQSLSLAAALAQFNRKERFCLLRNAVGLPFDRLDPDFCKRLGQLLKIEVPSDAWWAFDYHIDWLFGALLILANRDKPVAEIGPRKNFGHVTGSQEDCDLVIAFGTTLILVEAKTGDWSNAQINSKISRLASLSVQHITPYLVLTSPKKPTKLQVANWPEWALHNMNCREPFWLELPFMDGIEEPLMVSRCDSEGSPSRSGDHWGVYPP